MQRDRRFLFLLSQAPPPLHFLPADPPSRHVSLPPSAGPRCRAPLSMGRSASATSLPLRLAVIIGPASPDGELLPYADSLPPASSIPCASSFLTSLRRSLPTRQPASLPPASSIPCPASFLPPSEASKAGSFEGAPATASLPRRASHTAPLRAHHYDRRRFCVFGERRRKYASRFVPSPKCILCLRLPLEDVFGDLLHCEGCILRLGSVVRDRALFACVF